MSKSIDELRMLVCGFSEVGYPRDETIMAAVQRLPFKRLYDLRVTDAYWTQWHLDQTRNTPSSQDAAYQRLRKLALELNLQGLARRIRSIFNRKSRLAQRTRLAQLRTRSLILTRQVDVIFVMKCNEDLLPDICRWAQKLDIPVVYDLWVSRYLMAQRDRQRVNEWHQTEKSAVGRCDHLLALTSPYRDFYVETYGCRPEKVSVLPLAVEDPWLHQPRCRTRPQDDGTLIVAYWGLAGKQHGLDVALGAAYLLRAESDIQFRFYGAEKILKPILEDRGLTNTRFFGYLPERSSLIRAIDDVDICFGHLAPLHDAHLVLPNKAMEGMARGKVALHVDNEPLRDLYARAGTNHGAVMFFTGGAQGLASTISELYRSPQLRGLIGNSARQRISSDHSVAAVEMAWQKMIEKL